MIEVFEVKEKTTNKTAFASKVTLTFKADKDLQDVNIVEVIPKSVAASIANVVFLGEQPKVLQADPIVHWVFPAVEEGQTKHLSYQVPKKIETLETETIGVATEKVLPKVPEERKSKLSITGVFTAVTDFISKPVVMIVISATGIVSLTSVIFIVKKVVANKKPWKANYGSSYQEKVMKSLKRQIKKSMGKGQ